MELFFDSLICAWRQHAAARRLPRMEVVFKNTIVVVNTPGNERHFQAEVNLVTALVPSDTACLASSPGRMRRTAV